VSDSQGRVHVFGPDDEVPEWAHEKITNTHAWAEPPTVSRLTEPTPAPKPATKRAAPRRKAATSGSDQ
jgi:hypothetical protein